MGIERIISIKNVGRFKDCSAKGDVGFARYTLVFAENGRGKTTFCAVLRSLNLGEPTFVLGRKTLGSTGNPEVTIRHGGGNATFARGVWDQTIPDIAIFDSTFVSENVYSGDAVGHDHKRNLYQVIVGKQGVTLQRTYAQEDAAVKAKADEIRAAQAVVQPLVPAGTTVEAFAAAQPDADIDAKIAAKDGELRAVKEVAALLTRRDLAPVQLPALPTDFDAALGATVDGIAADVGEKLAAHLAAHDMEDRGEAWLSEGLGYIKKDACPFCGQGVNGVALVDALKGFFSAAYAQLKTRIERVRRETEMALGDRVIGQIETAIAQNGATREFWSRYCEIALPELVENDIGTALRSVRDEAIALLDNKSRAILEPVTPGNKLADALALLARARQNAERYNSAVRTANAAIATKKAATKGADEAAITRELARLQAMKRRGEQRVADACTALGKLSTEKTALEAKKEAAKNALDQYTDRVISNYESAINRYLDHFNAGFRIGRTTYDYRGAGVPRSNYQIVINDVGVELGDATTPTHVPSFKNTLSSGDRSTLALAFFLAQLDQDPDRARKIVVFDDPFTSQDSFRRAETVRKIIRSGTDCAQVVVLSHDLYFLDQLWKQLQPGDRKSLCFARVGRENTVIQAYDLEAALNLAYRHDIEALQRYYTEGSGTQREIAMKLRPTVEAYLRNVYPQEFADLDSLGKMLAKIREGGTAHPLTTSYDTLEAINAYGTPFQHAPKPGAPVPPIDDAELRGYCKRVLEFVGAG